MGFEKLIDVLLEFIDLFRFWQVIDAYEQGIVLRLGQYNRTLEPGIHWLAPFGIEQSLNDNITVRTNAIAALTITNHQGQSIHADAIIKWRIRDLKKFLLEVDSADDVIKDVAYSTISRTMRGLAWEQLINPEVDDYLTKECRRRGFRYGVEIESVELGDLVQSLPISILE